VRIERIYIATHKPDLRLTRICVASIRYWYPDLPIYLIKDLHNGDFSTAEIERVWNVQIYQTEQRRFGWGMSKLEPLFSEPQVRMLILDADTVFAGPVIELLERSSSDFVVSLEQQPAQRVSEIYFDVARLADFDPAFSFAGSNFNTGQYVATGGRQQREDFAAIDWTTTPASVKHPEIFKNGDQGVLNYVLLKRAACGQLTLAGIPFMRWPGDGIDDIELPQLAHSSPYQYVIHWAGLKRTRLRAMVRADILTFFEKYYYSRIRFGQVVRCYRAARETLTGFTARIARRLKANWTYAPEATVSMKELRSE
jgi:hypothetical protein